MNDQELGKMHRNIFCSELNGALKKSRSQLENTALFVFYCSYISLQSSLWESEMSDLEAYTLEDLLNLSYSRDVSELTLFEVLMA